MFADGLRYALAFAPPGNKIPNVTGLNNQGRLNTFCLIPPERHSSLRTSIHHSAVAVCVVELKKPLADTSVAWMSDVSI